MASWWAYSDYLKKYDSERYKTVISKLGIRK
jgi:ribosomal protein S15P/S13E